MHMVDYNKPKTELDAIRQDLTGFVREIGLEFYLHNSGQKDKLEISGIYERYGHLFSKDLARNCLERWASAESGEEERTYKHLHQFAFFGYIGNQNKALVEELARQMNATSITVRGETISYYSISHRLMNEPDREIRREIDDKQAEADISLNKLRREKLAIAYGVFKEFGYGSYREGSEKIQTVDFEALSSSLQGFLDLTEDEYTKSFDELSHKKLGYPLDKAAKCDFSYLLRGQEWDKFFPKEGMVQKATAFLKDLEIPLAEMPAITVDIEEREKKRPRAFCSPVRIGEEVYICTRPSGGMSDYLTFLHELGHACHFANTDSNLPAEYTMVGDSATSEIFAFNFNYLGADPLWLQTYLGIEEPSEIVEFLRLQKLYMLRRYASKFLYELELHKDYHIDGRADLYDKFLSEGLKVPHRWEYWLSDLDDGFYSAGYLRAWIFEMQLREGFREEFGADWWRDPAAGHRLKEHWRTGRMYMPEEMSDIIFGSPLDLGPITREVMG
jgi:hypothetical protein